MDDGEEDYVFYGTPIEREEDVPFRKRKAGADAGQLRTLPPWKQEVTDEEGRRRFHGAFTGGFSAGFYNTVGSNEGWTPQKFSSSRKNRAEVIQQSIYSFMDDEDIKDIGGNGLETSTQFDTFGFTAAEFARKQAEKDQEKRPSAIPGPVPDDIILPAADSIGIKLLQKMGWRQGRLIKEMHAESLHDARREARKALIAFSGGNGEPDFSPTVSEVIEMHEHNFDPSRKIPEYVLHPKQDLHGLGFDPFKHAPEFRDKKDIKSGNTVRDSRRYFSAVSSGKLGQRIGSLAHEEHEDDEDFYASGFFEVEEVACEEVEPTKAVEDNGNKLIVSGDGFLFGFKVASNIDLSLERFYPPAIPADFKPQHKFPCDLEFANTYVEVPPSEVPPPEDSTLKCLIDGFATLVARCGKMFEDLSKEKHKSNQLFSFLSGGSGHAYYERKLWEAKQTNSGQKMPLDVKPKSIPKLTAESRGRILGERPLEKSSIDSASSSASKDVIQLQSNLSDTFTGPASLVGLSETMKPFNADPAKQRRFEQFLKDKYRGGLRSTYSGESDMMSENERARERLDFESAAVALEKGESNMKVNPQSILNCLEFMGMGESKFIPAGTEKHHNARDDRITGRVYPKREEFQWRPYPILCKRFDISDPYMGKPPPVSRPRSKMDTLVLIPDSGGILQQEDIKASVPDSSSMSLKEMRKTGKSIATEDVEKFPDRTVTQHIPVDLYKAIFSDDSEDEEDGTRANEGEDLPKKTGGVNETLNRLIAGDFLESVGKELGLMVPPDNPSQQSNKNFSSKEAKVEGADPKNLSGGNIQGDAAKIPNTVQEVKPTSSQRMPQVLSRDSGGDKLYREAASRIEKVVVGESSFPKDKLITEGKEDEAGLHETHLRRGSRRYISDDDDDDDGYDSPLDGRHSRQLKSRAEKRSSSPERSRRHAKHHRHKRRKSSCDDTDKNDRDVKERVKDEGSRHRESHSSRSKSHGHRRRH